MVGIFYYLNGDMYDGEWKNSKEDGKGNSSSGSVGVLHHAKGGSYAGEWRNGKKLAKVARELTIGTRKLQGQAFPQNTD